MGVTAFLAAGTGFGERELELCLFFFCERVDSSLGDSSSDDEADADRFRYFVLVISLRVDRLFFLVVFLEGVPLEESSDSFCRDSDGTDATLVEGGPRLLNRNDRRRANLSSASSSSMGVPGCMFNVQCSMCGREL